MQWSRDTVPISGTVCCWPYRFFYYIVAVLLCWNVAIIPPVSGSLGDRLVPYRSCLHNCTAANCSTAPSAIAKWSARQDKILQWTGWTCRDECRYDCMWLTVQYVHNLSYPTPQFHGKWPFIRFLGMQEPASVLFSIGNLMSFLYFLHLIRINLPPNSTMRSLWTQYSYLGIFTWLCSTAYHFRDTYLTEKLDYFCAFASVLFGFYSSLFRMFDRRRVKFWGRLMLGYFIVHVCYLYFVKFDYGYNMKANVTAGLCNSAAWLYWMYGEVRRTDGEAWPRVRHGAFVIICALLFVNLELLDFPPLLYTFDAHSIWHALTIPLPIFWAEFVIADSLYLQQSLIKLE